ncbi:MAG: cadherin-like domain-containing protein [Hydrococcus sp. C42_A2020_068]|nr:hypothetical protein Ple7327_3596 [Pleurocapsa sp. PCC 7327]MBF2020180.1 cadherin-like domain-containing protein [Hydrococcus sp. C42_A2020_068]
MLSNNRQVSSTISQPLVGIFSNDDLTMPLKLEQPFGSLEAVSSRHKEDNSEKLDKEVKSDKINGQFSSIVDFNGNGNSTKIENANDKNLQNHAREAKFIPAELGDKNFSKKASKTSTYRLTKSSENLKTSAQNLNAKEAKMQSDRVSSDRLVMHLKFEETSGIQATDSSPYGKNRGELRNGATFKKIDGSFGGVVSFDGVNDYLRVGDSHNINTGTYAKRTLSLWFKVDDKNIADRKQVIYEEGGRARGLNIYVHNGRLYVGAWNNPASESNWKGTYLSTNTISSNKWHHVTVVLNAKEGSPTLQAGALTAYLDGSKFGTGQGSQLWSHSDDIGIGAINQGTQFHDGDVQGTGTNAFKGSIDDVRVYNRVLTDKEIATLANHQSSGNTSMTPQSASTNSTTNTPPVAKADKATTTEDKQITLSATKLLENDRDANGDLLKITGVSNTTNGTAALDKNGNITFTPKNNFIGDASFQYTVSDGRGGTAKATVTVSVLAQPEPASSSVVSIGTNLSGIADWSTQMPFLDAFKSSRSWFTQNKSTWDTKEANKLDLDKNGWVKSLPNADSGSKYTSVGTLLFRDKGGRYPGGQYVVLYEGQGTIEYGFDAKKNSTASRPGRDVIDVTPSNEGIWLKITATDPNKTGNYLRNIRVVPIDYEKTYQSQIFNPKFIEKVDDFSAFRFMDWMKTNNSSQSHWSDRPTLQTARYSTHGTPVEVMVELANQTDTDPWFTMPHLASDEYVTNFASYVKNHLEPERKVYVEYSNEVWNKDFQQSQWALQQGKKEWGGSGDSDTVMRLNWYSKRTTEITQIWDRVFGEDKARVIGVMGAQAANIGVAQQVISYDWTDKPLSHQAYGIDAIAIAPYIGYYLGAPENASQIASWTRDSDGGRKKLFDEIIQGGVLSGGPKGGALQQSYDGMKAHIDLARKENLQLIAYEGGQHLAGFKGVEDNAAITKLFIEANRDPRMGDVYRQYLQKWFELGGGTFMNFVDIGQPSKWGSWGLLEHVEQNGSPKYDAIMDIIH